jgi:hypothetical protein
VRYRHYLVDYLVPFQQHLITNGFVLWDAANRLTSIPIIIDLKGVLRECTLAGTITLFGFYARVGILMERVNE